MGFNNCDLIFGWVFTSRDSISKMLFFVFCLANSSLRCPYDKPLPSASRGGRWLPYKNWLGLWSYSFIASYLTIVSLHRRLNFVNQEKWSLWLWGGHLHLILSVGIFILMLILNVLWLNCLFSTEPITLHSSNKVF